MTPTVCSAWTFAPQWGAARWRSGPETRASRTTCVPSKVEFLLDDVDGFPEQFVSVIERSVSGDKGLAALITATEQVIAGEELGVHARTRPVALLEQRWVPKLEIARRKGQNQAAARLSITLGLEDLKARTHEWLVDQEKYVGQFLQHSLGDYLTDPLTPAPERKNRQSRLVGHFESMVKASLPLVALEPAMTNLIHGHDVPPYNLHVSTLNVPSQLEDVRQQIKDAAVALLKTPQAVKFSNTPRQDAMMMTLLSEPYHLVEVASIMSPISKQWSKGGQGRELWQYRRARPLSEWVPLGPDARRALVTGWFAARLLGTASADGEGGTELSVKVEGKTLQGPEGWSPTAHQARPRRHAARSASRCLPGVLQQEVARWRRAVPVPHRPRRIR